MWAHPMGQLIRPPEISMTGMLHCPCACGAIDVLLGVAQGVMGQAQHGTSAGIWAMPCDASSSGLGPSGCLSSTAVGPAVCPAGASLRSLRPGICSRRPARTARTTTHSKSCLDEAGCLDQRWPCMLCLATEQAAVCPLKAQHWALPSIDTSRISSAWLLCMCGAPFAPNKACGG